jgi:hypothetical protein
MYISPQAMAALFKKWAHHAAAFGFQAISLQTVYSKPSNKPYSIICRLFVF